MPVIYLTNFSRDTNMFILTYNVDWEYSVPNQKLLEIKHTFRFLYKMRYCAYLVSSFDSNTPQNYNATSMIYNLLRDLSWSLILAVNKAVFNKNSFLYLCIKLYPKQKRHKHTDGILIQSWYFWTGFHKGITMNYNPHRKRLNCIYH